MRCKAPRQRVAMAAGAGDGLARMVGEAGRLPARSARDGEPALPGLIYTAVPDRHLIVTDGDVLRLGHAPRKNRVRPAVDALFQTAARWSAETHGRRRAPLSQMSGGTAVRVRCR